MDSLTATLSKSNLNILQQANHEVATEKCLYFIIDENNKILHKDH